MWNASGLLRCEAGSLALSLPDVRGQQQLVSIMRALVVDPEVLFLDEPFSALDYEMTLFLRAKLQQVLGERQVTALLVSHDLDEAIEMADEVLLLTKKPTRVAARYGFSAPRPRNEESSLTPEFIVLKGNVWPPSVPRWRHDAKTHTFRTSPELRPLFGLVALIALWALAHHLRLADPVLLPSPSEAWTAFWNDLMRGTLWRISTGPSSAPRSPLRWHCSSLCLWVLFWGHRKTFTGPWNSSSIFSAPLRPRHVFAVSCSLWGR